MHERVDLEQELATLASAARERRSVDLFLRAALEGMGWVIVTGIAIKLFRDSARTPLFLWPLLLLDLLLLCDAIRSYVLGRRNLRRELRLEARVRELRAALGIDP